MNLQAAIVERWTAVTERYPLLRFLATWGISIASLIGGILTLFVFRRGLRHVGWIVGYLILLWLLFTLLAQVRHRLETKGRTLIVTAADYTVQTLNHGLLLFILPGYYASTTLTSANVWFFLLLVTLTLITTVDVWYRAIILPWRWTRHALFAFSFFAALNVALPLVGIPPILALVASAILSVLALAPTFQKVGVVGSAVVWLRAGLFAILAAWCLWWLRAWIPPAPLQLARATIARAVENLDPVNPVSGRVSAQVVGEWGGLVAYTAVYAPAGLSEQIYHVWKKDGRIINTVMLSPIKGGRAEGFRTYSRKSDFGPDPVGRWTVDVQTSSGQLIGRVRFRVEP